MKMHDTCSTDVVFGPEKKCVVLSLPYTGDVCD